MILSLIKLFFVIPYTIFIASIVCILVPLTGSERLFHRLARFHARGVLMACGIKVRVEGLENLSLTRNYIYVSNHASVFDIPAVIAGIPDEIRIVYKKELERIPVFGWGMKLGKTYIPVDRMRGQDAMQSLEEASNKIRGGASVLLFAEGTRTPDGSLQPFKRGAFNLAVRAGVPVVPLTIKGSYNILPKKSFRIQGGLITLVLDMPIEPPTANGRSSELQLMEQVRAVIEKHFTES
jgi:1-acyl-sn-glycerol-3-phosphate acyltransferase